MDDNKKKIIVVDDKDEIVGHKYRGSLAQGDIYRVSALWVTDTKGNSLLAKRAHTKAHHPGKWGPAVAGTVEEGETYEDNITKEAEEELGITNVLFRVGPKTLTIGEYNHFGQWYTASLDWGLERFVVQKSEVAEIRWFPTISLLQTMREKADDFLPDLAERLESIFSELTK